MRDTDRVMIHTGSSWSDLAAGLHLSGTDRLLGRASSGAGAAEEIVCTAVGRALIGAVDAQEQCALLGTWHVLAASAVASSITGSTSKTALATINVPAGAMGANGRLRATTHFAITASGNTKTLSFEFGGSVFYSRAEAGATVATYRDQREIANRNNTSSQVSWRSTSIGGFGGGTAATTTGAVNTASAQQLIIYGQLANAGETITLESYIVELLYQA